MTPIGNDQVALHTRTLTIVMLALAAGVFILAGIFASIDAMGDVDNFSLPVLFGLAGAVGAGAMRAAVPPLAAKAGLQQLAREEPDDDAAKVCGLFVTNRIIAAALLEGAAMLNLMIFKIEHNPINLGVGVLLGIAIAAHIPSQYQMLTWVEARIREIKELRATNW